MNRPLKTAVAMLGGALLISYSAPAHAAGGGGTICVGHRVGCTTLAAAVAAAQDGDTIRIDPGTYPGGVEIDHDVTVVGAGASKTRIQGGGPVITIGAPLSADPPAVEIRDLTITGGFTRRLDDRYGSSNSDATAAGGGIFVSFGADGGPGGSLRLVDAAVRGNRVSPTSTILVPPDQLPCPGNGCLYAGSFGAGIESAGALTLIRTTVSDNRAGIAASSDDVSSDATGAGINVPGPGTLTMVDSEVKDNVAAVTTPNGRFAEGAGVWLDGPTAVIKRSRVTGNSANLHTAFGDDVENIALAGGIRNGVDNHLVLTDSVVADNASTAVNDAGTANSWGGGMHLNGTIDMTRSKLARNAAVAGTPDGAFPAYADGAGAEIDGDYGEVSTITDSSVRGNRMLVRSHDADVTVEGVGLWTGPLDPGSITIKGSEVSDNEAVGATQGQVTGRGVGIRDIGGISLQHTRVHRNRGLMQGSSGVGQGGGIFVGRYPDDPTIPATPRLSATNSEFVGNRLRLSPGVTGAGGGIYSETPATLKRTEVRDNTPKPQCVGCGGAPGARVAAAAAAASSDQHAHTGVDPAIVILGIFN